MNYPLLDIFLTTMWLFLWILWFFLLFRVFGDLFRDHKTGGWAKAGWTVFLIAVPFLGVLVYLIARGRGMSEREMARAEQSQQELRAYVQQAATESGNGSAEPARATSGSGHVDELAKLADLKNQGDITDEEYRRAKEHVLAA